MREIAGRAEVGPATLYRRFPTRQALITEAFAGQRERALRAVGEPTRRAKAGGRLRPDVVLADLILALRANSGVRAETPAEALVAARRFAALQIEGFRARPGASLLPPAPRLLLLPIG